MLVELYVKANRVEEALTAAKRGITVCKELGDTAAQAKLGGPRFVGKSTRAAEQQISLGLCGDFMTLPSDTLLVDPTPNLTRTLLDDLMKTRKASLMLTVGRARLRMAQLDKAIAIAQDAFAMLKKIPTTTQKICDDKARTLVGTAW